GAATSGSVAPACAAALQEAEGESGAGGDRELRLQLLAHVRRLADLVAKLVDGGRQAFPFGAQLAPDLLVVSGGHSSGPRWSALPPRSRPRAPAAFPSESASVRRGRGSSPARRDRPSRSAGRARSRRPSRARPR